MIIRIGCIVEGHGDVEAVPILVRRLARELDPDLAVETPRPIRVPKDRLLKTGELERHVEETLHQAPLTAVLDFALARRAQSFARCEREIVRLCRLLRDKRSAG